MKSLFLKILLWFLAVMAVTVGGFILTTASVMSATRGREHLFGRMLAFQTEEARHAYESGGKEGLTAFLGRFQNVFQARGILTDGSGRDLLTGADRSDLIEAAQPAPRARFACARPCSRISPKMAPTGSFYWCRGSARASHISCRNICGLSWWWCCSPTFWRCISRRR